jgi:hypothetical protein
MHLWFEEKHKREEDSVVPLGGARAGGAVVGLSFLYQLGMRAATHALRYGNISLICLTCRQCSIIFVLKLLLGLQKINK